MNLRQLIKDKIEELGPKEAAAFFKIMPAQLAKWANGSASPSVDAAQLVLDEAIKAGRVIIPSPTAGIASEDSVEDVPGEVRADFPEPSTQPETSATVPASKIAILSPTNRGFDLYSVMTILGSWKATVPEEIRAQLAHFHGQRDTLIHLARNLLAQRFLASDAAWSFWLDSDIIAPIGNPKWFKSKTRSPKLADEFAGKTAIAELTRSESRMIVSGVYATRDGTGRIVAHCGMHKGAKGETVTAPARRIIQQPWVGFGCVAVHRKVFEDIMAKQPELASTTGGPFGFFNPVDGENNSEDVAFCKRAKNAGHAAYLDLSVVCGHVGNQAFMP